MSTHWCCHATCLTLSKCQSANELLLSCLTRILNGLPTLASSTCTVTWHMSKFVASNTRDASWANNYGAALPGQHDVFYSKARITRVKQAQEIGSHGEICEASASARQWKLFHSLRLLYAYELGLTLPINQPSQGGFMPRYICKMIPWICPTGPARSCPWRCRVGPRLSCLSLRKESGRRWRLFPHRGRRSSRPTRSTKPLKQINEQTKTISTQNESMEALEWTSLVQTHKLHKNYETNIEINEHTNLTKTISMENETM